LDTLTLPNGSVRTQLYNDPGDQLQSITYKNSVGTALGAWTYAYDPNSGRLQSMTDSFAASVNIAGNALATTTYDDANEIAAIGATSLGHDANGSQTSDIGLTFSFDARGRLIQTVKGTLTTHYEINAFGLRDRKYASNGSETRFVYDLKGHLIAELDKNNATILEYVWFGNMPVMVRNYVAGVASEFYIYSDNLNTPRRVIVPSTSAARWVWNSDPFGNGIPNGNPAGIGGYTFHLRFPGQFYDAETGLNYNVARNYNPTTARYIESDPLGFRAGFNQYVYCGNNPISDFDEWGLDYQLSLGVSGTLFGLTVGGGGGASFGISSNGTLKGTYLFVSGQANLMGGAGAFAGIGATIGAGHSEGPPTSGTAQGLYGELDLGGGEAVSLSGQMDFEGNPSAAGGGPLRITPGVGFGIAAGVGVFQSTTLVSPSVAEMVQRVRKAFESKKANASGGK
jgi:RHS repeat-associated protein